MLGVCLAEYILSQSGHGSHGGPTEGRVGKRILMAVGVHHHVLSNHILVQGAARLPIADQEQGAPRPSRRPLAHSLAVHQQAVGEPQSLKKGAGIMQTIMRRTVLVLLILTITTLSPRTLTNSVGPHEAS